MFVKKYLELGGTCLLGPRLDPPLNRPILCLLCYSLTFSCSKFTFTL